MKHAFQSTARNCQDRSHKNCVCGGHSQKARKPRRRERQRQETAEKRKLDQANVILVRLESGSQPLGPCPFCNGEDH
jgi:hypothetical protein